MSKIFKKVLIGGIFLCCAAFLLIGILGARSSVNKIKEDLATPTPVVKVAEKTPIPVPTATPEPSTEPATARYDISILAKTLTRGDKVTVLGEEGDYYRILDAEGNELYAKMCYIRTADDEMTEEHTEYAASSAEIYDNAMLSGDPVTVLTINTPVNVLDRLCGISYVMYQEAEDAPKTYGFMSDDDLNESEVRWDWGGGGDGGYSGGGGSGGGGDSGGGGGGGGYGDDIVLCYCQRPDLSIRLLPSVRLLASSVSADKGTEGTVFADSLEAYAGFADKGGTVDLIAKKDDEEWTVLCNHMVCTIPAHSVLLEGEEEPFEEFEGYVIMGGGTMYSDQKLTADAQRLPQNSKMNVVAQYGDVYEVEITEDSINLEYRHGFMPVEEVTAERHVWVDAGGGGDGGYSGGGGDSGGGGGGGGDWSDFVM